MRLRVLIVISVTLSSTTLVAPEAQAQTAADSAGIRAAALDYIEGWYTADAPRMQRALHPELAKRIVVTDSTSGKSQLGQMGAMTLIEYTRKEATTNVCACLALSGLQRPGDLVRIEDDAGRRCLRADELE
jgi:hypothetical protein